MDENVRGGSVSAHGEQWLAAFKRKQAESQHESNINKELDDFISKSMRMHPHAGSESAAVLLMVADQIEQTLRVPRHEAITKAARSPQVKAARRREVS